MESSCRPSCTLVALAVLASAVVSVVNPRAVHADPTLCKRALSSESAKYTRTVTQALEKCEAALVATTCIPSSESSILDSTVGLPGPGALSISGTTTVGP